MNLPASDALLTRDKVAATLTEAGYPISGATLATKATRGGGPPYRLFGRRPLYRWGDAISWAESKLTKPVQSTSELAALRCGHLAPARFVGEAEPDVQQLIDADEIPNFKHGSLISGSKADAHGLVDDPALNDDLPR
jgi:hypothetical protein